MPGGGFWDHRAQPLVRARNISPDGRWTFALGLMSLMLGFAAIAGGIYLGMGTSARLSLPGGLPATPSETVAIILASCGAITTLLGVVSLYKAHDA